MTIAKTAYDTTACSGYVLNKVTHAADVAQANGMLEHDEDGYNLYLVKGGSSVVDEIPLFTHPVILSNNNADPVLCVDLRAYGKWDRDQNTFNIKNNTEHNLAIHRGRLNDIWLNNDPSILRNISPAPMALYAAWISEAVGRRFALDPKEQFNLAILAAIFYSSQFHNKDSLDEEEKLKLINNVAKNVRASASDVLAIIDKVDVIHSLSEFCKLTEEVTGSVRMREFNPGILFAIVGGSWFGAINAKELIAVALEHPPTWITVLLYAFNDKSFHNTQISKITERSTYRDLGKDYVRAVLNLLHVMGDGKK